jgi:ParB-like chromosome segregation protein Spo0J
MQFPVDAIKIGTRHRKDMGDLGSLKASMQTHGILQPLGLDEADTLIFGERRLRAAIDLGWASIEVRRVHLDDPLGAEFDENECRKPFTPSERVEIAAAIEAREAEKAKGRQTAKLKVGNSEIPRAENFSQREKHCENEENGRAKDKAAKAVGMSRPTLEKAKAVVEAAKADPSLAPVVEEMDRTGKIDPAFRKITEAKEEVIDETPWLDEWGIPITKVAASAFESQPKFDELVKALQHAKKLFKALAEGPGGQFLCRMAQNKSGSWVHPGLENCIMHVKDCKPRYTVCPYAYSTKEDYVNGQYRKHEDGCNLCHGLGWTVKITGSMSVPEEFINRAKEANGVEVLGF